MADRTLTEQLQKTFRGQATKHIRLNNSIESPRKDITTVQGEATTGDYAAHLCPRASSGPGGVGLYPGFGRHKKPGQWTNWAVLDFDAHTPEDLMPLFEVLSRQGLQVLANRGTTGRGMHLWFLLHRPIPLAKAVASLKFLQRTITQLGLGKVELRPETANGGSAVMLPYRGAGEDGEGFNPLTDYSTGEIISIRGLASREPQDANRFIALGRLRSVERFITGTYRPAPRLHTREESVIGKAEQTDRWASELSRLATLWTKGQRYYLTLGATSHGLNCKVPSGQIESDLMALIERCNDEEAPQRQNTIRDTLRRHHRGQAVSASYFYSLAGVASPEKTGDEVRSIVTSLWHAMMENPWKTPRGKSARSVYRALLKMAYHHGHHHPAGVEVSLSWAQLEREAEVGSSSTLRNSLSFLEERKLLCRGAEGREYKSGSFILLVTERSTLIRGDETRGCFNLSPMFRNGNKKLGKTAEHFYELLAYHGPLSLQDLAAYMATRSTDLRKHRDRLLDSGLVCEDANHRLHVGADAVRDLSVQEEHDGTDWARARQLQRHRKKQTSYQAYLEARKKGSAQGAEANKRPASPEQL